MVNTRAIGRIGMLVVGLGFGAAMASTGVASADPFTWLDPLSAATSPSPFDLDISIDGFQVLDLGDGTAVAASGIGDTAIAFGANSHATAEGGFGDFATAATGATAFAGDPFAGATGNNFDFASAGGIGSDAIAGNTNFPDTIGSSFDYASASSGNNTSAVDGADAEAGFNGSDDSASAIGQQVGVIAGDGSNAGTPANFDTVFAFGNLSAPTAATTEAFARLGSGDNAFVIDPLGTAGSSAEAGGVLGGAPGNFDLAGALGDMLHATAIGSNMFEILPSLF